jgi:putative transposase
LPVRLGNAHAGGLLQAPRVPAGRHPAGRLAGWRYSRFNLSLRDVEEMPAQRGTEASYETVRCWTLKFGRAFARILRPSRPKPTGRWHLDEMVVKTRGERMWLWRAFDDEGEVLDMLVQRRRNTGAALRLPGKLPKRNGIHPESSATGKLAAYRAAFRELHCSDRHRAGRMLDNNRAENSRLGSGDRGRLSDRPGYLLAAQRLPELAVLPGYLRTAAVSASSMTGVTTNRIMSFSIYGV